MDVLISNLWLQKDGNAKSEYEDAFFPVKRGNFNGNLLRFSVADGATESMFAGKWAEILVKTFCRSRLKSTSFAKIYNKAFESWDLWQKNYIINREKRNKPLQWFEEWGLQRGSFATFLGINLMESKKASKGRWEAFAVGDSCLFHFRNDSLLSSFPVEDISEFGNTPDLISTNPRQKDEFKKILHTKKGTWHIDDQFYLMTDALAAWLMGCFEENMLLLKSVLNKDEKDEMVSFENLINDLRAIKRIRNDDVTLLYIKLS